MSYTKRLPDAELGQIDPQEEDRLIDEGRRTIMHILGSQRRGPDCTVMAEDITIADDMGS